MKGLIVLMLLFLAAPAPARAQVAVVAHTSVPDQGLSSKDLLDLYSLDRSKWGDGSRVVLVDQKADSGTKAAFYSHIGQSSADLKKVWLRMKLSGDGQPPQQAGSDAEVLQMVASTPGAVGYVDAGNVGDGVKVLATIN